MVVPNCSELFGFTFDDRILIQRGAFGASLKMDPLTIRLMCCGFTRVSNWEVEHVRTVLLNNVTCFEYSTINPFGPLVSNWVVHLPSSSEQCHNVLKLESSRNKAVHLNKLSVLLWISSKWLTDISKFSPNQTNSPISQNCYHFTQTPLFCPVGLVLLSPSSRKLVGCQLIAC